MKRNLLAKAVAFALANLAFSAVASTSLRIETAPTVEQQLALANAAATRALITPYADSVARQMAIASAIGTYELVPRRWPHQKRAIAEAYEHEAELMQASQLDLNAVDVLRKAVAEVGDTDRGPVLYRLLGQSLQRVHRTADAQEAFEKAETHPRFAGLTGFEKEQILVASGFFFEQQHLSAEAAARYRAAADLPGVASLRAGSHLLRSADLDSSVSPERSRKDIDKLQKIIDGLRLQNLTARGDINTLELLETELTRLKKKTKG